MSEWETVFCVWASGVWGWGWGGGGRGGDGSGCRKAAGAATITETSCVMGRQVLVQGPVLPDLCEGLSKEAETVKREPSVCMTREFREPVVSEICPNASLSRDHTCAATGAATDYQT